MYENNEKYSFVCEIFKEKERLNKRELETMLDEFKIKTRNKEIILEKKHYRNNSE